MKFKKVQINWQEKPVEVTLKSLNFGESNALNQECAELKMVGNQSQITVNHSKMKEGLILKSIQNAPFPATIDSIRSLEVEDGNILFNACQELMGVGFQEKEISDGSQEETEPAIKK